MPSQPRIQASAAAPLAALALTVGLAACGALGDIPTQGPGPVVTVTIHGGECASAPCDQSVIVDPDGRVHAAAKPPNDLGHVPAAQMTALTAAIAATDFAKLKSHPFTGTCPTAVDGQELIFEFPTSSGDWGSPLFVALGAALAQWVPLPRT